jgi:recombination protein RecT
MKSNEIAIIFSRYREQISMAIPKHLTTDRVIQLATLMASRSPQLKECTVASLIGAVMQASILGFEPVSSLQQCYFVPFTNRKANPVVKEVVFQLGFRGYINLAYRTGSVKSLYAYCVYEQDEFQYQLGTDPFIKHIPALSNRGAIVHSYAVCQTLHGTTFIVLGLSDIELARSKSPAGKDPLSPWNSGFYDDMAAKTAIRKLMRFVPLSIEFQRALEADEQVITPARIKSEQPLDIEDILPIEEKSEQPAAPQQQEAK